MRGHHLATGSRPHSAPAGTPSDNCHLAYVVQAPWLDHPHSSRCLGSTRVAEEVVLGSAAAVEEEEVVVAWDVA